MMRYLVQPTDRIFVKGYGTGDLIGNKITNKSTKVWRSSLQNNSEIITNKHDNEIPRERYVSPEERRKVIGDLTLV